MTNYEQMTIFEIAGVIQEAADDITMDFIFEDESATRYKIEQVACEKGRITLKGFETC